MEFISAARKRFPDMQLMVDAHSVLYFERLATPQEIDDYNLIAIEQRLAWDEVEVSGKGTIRAPTSPGSGCRVRGRRPFVLAT